MANPFLTGTPSEPEPVRVIEKIPIGAPTSLSPAAIAAEKIPSPSHLVPELGRGGMGHVHPAMDEAFHRPLLATRRWLGDGREARDEAAAERVAHGDSNADHLAL